MYENAASHFSKDFHSRAVKTLSPLHLKLLSAYLLVFQKEIIVILYLKIYRTTSVVNSLF
jgi:hypothetical protein